MRQDDVDYLNRESTQRVTTKLIMDKAKYKSLFQLLLLNVQQTIWITYKILETNE